MTKPTMRILLVNWVDDTDPLRRGGGVAVYQHNLVQALSKREGVEVTTLSSGLAHGVFRRRPRIERLPVPKSAERPGVRRFALVNSAVLAPSHADFAGLAQVSDAATEAAFAGFLARTGPYDVIHFNNLEGLPAGVLQVGRAHPSARQIVSLHNYYPFCPQVNFWFDEKQSCGDFAEGRKCVNCLPLQPNRQIVRLAYAAEWECQRYGVGPGTRFYDAYFRLVLRSGWRALKRTRQLMQRLRGADSSAPPAALPPAVSVVAPVPAPAPVPPAAPVAAVSAASERRIPASAGGLAARSAAPRRSGKGSARAPKPVAAPAPVPTLVPVPDTLPPASAESRRFVTRRAAMVELINRNCDSLLCVSDRVRQIALHHGIAPVLARTCYIGSPHAAHWQQTEPRAGFLDPEGRLRLAYLGYMRRDKGFHFLMEALLALPKAQAERLHLTLAAGSGDPEAMALVGEVQAHLGAVEHHNGYSHSQLDGLLERVGLGLVPVMWEDNLPQVAIEMHARHIPLLTSDMGGAQELGRCPDLIFKAGDAAAFGARIAAVLEGRVSLDAYWAGAMPPTGMEAHLDALWQIYRGA